MFSYRHLRMLERRGGRKMWKGSVVDKAYWMGLGGKVVLFPLATTLFTKNAEENSH